jgi:O-antigen/teichoic acid export membrane protein
MKRNFAFTAMSVGSRLLVGLLLFLLLARLWGPEQFGLFSFAFSLSALLVLVVDFGFSLYLLREVAATPERAPQLVSECYRLKLRLVAVAASASVLVMFALGRQTAPPLLAIPLLIAALLMSFSDFFVAPLRALGRFDLEAGVVTVSNAVQFALAGSVAWQGGTPAAVAWAMALARLFYLCLALVAVHKVIPALQLRQPLIERPHVTLRRIWPYGIDGMLVTAWNQLDVVAVRVLFGTQALGLYTAGQKVVLGVGALAPVVGNVMIPRLARLASTRNQHFWTAAIKTSVLMASIGTVFALPLMLFPLQITHQLLGSSYVGLEELLPWFGGILIVRYLGAGAGVLITAAGLQSRRVVAQLAGLGVVAVLLPSIVTFDLELTHFIGIVMIGLVTMTLGYLWWLWGYHQGFHQAGGKA